MAINIFTRHPLYDIVYTWVTESNNIVYLTQNIFPKHVTIRTGEIIDLLLKKNISENNNSLWEFLRQLLNFIDIIYDISYNYLHIKINVLGVFN